MRRAAIQRCSWCLPFWREEGRDEISGLIPLAGFARQLLPPGGGERVELRAAIVLGLPPLRVDESFLLELEEGGVERAVVEREAILTDFLDTSRHAVAMERAEAFEGLEDHQGEGALLDFEFVGHGWSYGIPIPRYVLLPWRAIASYG